uniref:Uncharacterized protein n=1 Tax=Anguilla anguilla TaxID=7936 RepID=A0A0E9XI24_ANGAN
MWQQTSPFVDEFDCEFKLKSKACVPGYESFQDSLKTQVNYIETKIKTS